MDVDAIQQIPLCCQDMPDILVWHYTSSGLFSVRSAGHLQMNLSMRETRGSGSEIQNVTWFWKRVWRLRIPSKIKVFAWRCCSNILPVRSVIRRRHLMMEDMCACCGAEAETLMHCFWGCLSAMEVWQQSPISFVLDKEAGIDFMSWAYGIGCWFNEDTLGLSFVVCWGLSSSRNQALFNNLVHSAAATVQMVCALLKDYGRTQSNLGGVPLDREIEVETAG
ncbi:uncharacterized protein LOC114258640 [Camellia sinensis]|uniref:uncharacterized protein LOC114258640 n=1 Tax=Camellia sinensis TaxID=4442 RepID=UPI001035AF0C|nr:uncharacterized protein LOC114258640 [Camellia sinensis]